MLAVCLLSSPLAAAEIEVLPGTKPLTLNGDLSAQVVERVDAFLLRQIEQSVVDRQKLWSRDFSSTEAYVKSIEPNRQRFRRIIGIVDERLPFEDLQLVSTFNTAHLVAECKQFRVFAVRWPVLAGVDAEGLLLEPTGEAVAQVVALPDADWTPEMFAGLAPGVPPQSQIARRLAEAGCRVLVPTLIDRKTTWSGNPRIRLTNQTHREFIYRQAYFMGRHIIGYEVQKVLAAVDYFTRRNPTDGGQARPIAVAGYGEGGLLAFYSAACDPRIQASLVSGYFQPREQVWQEPVDRNVWGLLREFGDAEIAGLIAPRALVIEACRGPEIPGPPPPLNGQMDAASGKLGTPAFAVVRAEFDRARQQTLPLNRTTLSLIKSGKGQGPAGSADALKSLLSNFGLQFEPTAIDPPPLGDRRKDFDPTARLQRQFDQLVAFTQNRARLSPSHRTEFWAKADASSLTNWQASTASYREYLRDEIIGRLPPASLPPNARTRLLYDTPKWKGYEVVLEVSPDVIAYGALLVPKDLKPGERRPVVVAQHGRAGRPQDVCAPDKDTPAYHSFGAKLADRGFIVYAPQNLFFGEEKYRMLQRKANPLKLTFFAPMVQQHEQHLKWLASLPFVDARRIGFYGLSYGGKSAMLIPAALEGYALSICSGDFNEQVWKHVSVEDRYSFMFTKEHDHSEFDFGAKFNYAEIAGLIAPRPFMVERGHRDGVAPDEWVAYEYARVRRRYVELGIGARTEIEFFNGGHEIHSQGTFDFLHRHLDWPKPPR